MVGGRGFEPLTFLRETDAPTTVALLGYKAMIVMIVAFKIESGGHCKV